MVKFVVGEVKPPMRTRQWIWAVREVYHPGRLTGKEPAPWCWWFDNRGGTFPGGYYGSISSARIVRRFVRVDAESIAMPDVHDGAGNRSDGSVRQAGYRNGKYERKPCLKGVIDGIDLEV